MSEVEKEMESDLTPPRNDITTTTTEEEDGVDALTVIARCMKCGREMLSNGTQRGGSAFCKHQYMPVTVDQPPQQQIHRRAESPVSSISSASAFNTVRVGQSLQEAAALHEVQHNQFETQDYIKKFELASSDLGTNFDKCKTALEQEFEMLFDALTQRKEELISDLNKRYDERARRIEEQTTSLTNHNINADECKESCYRIMEEKQSREELDKRKNEVMGKCKEFIDKRPTVKEIPIKLEFRFGSRSSVVANLKKYGRLESKPVDSGDELPWTEADRTINPLLEDKNSNKSSRQNRSGVSSRLSQQQSSNGHSNRGILDRNDRYIGNSNNNNNNNNNYSNGGNEEKAESVDINREEIDDSPPNAEYGEIPNSKTLLVPSIRRIIVKCRDGQLRIEPVLKTPEFNNPNAVDEKEYEAYLKTNVFLQFECIGNNARDKLSNEQYENGLIRYRNCVPVEPDKSGKIFIDIPNESFENAMIVHVRARFVYLQSADYISDDGTINNEDVSLASDWSGDKTVTFKALENHICTFEGGSGVFGGANNNNNIINNNNGGNNELGFIPPPADQVESNSNYIQTSSPGSGGMNNMGNMGNMGSIGGGGISTNEATPVSSPPQLTHNKKRIKLKIDLQIQGQKVQSKQFPFKDEFSFDSLLQKTRQRAKIPDGNFEFWLKNDPNIKISNNNEFIQYCVIPDPDDRGYNAHIVAQQV